MQAIRFLGRNNSLLNKTADLWPSFSVRENTKAKKALETDRTFELIQTES